MRNIVLILATLALFASVFAQSIVPIVIDDYRVSTVERVTRVNGGNATFFYSTSNSSLIGSTRVAHLRVKVSSTDARELSLEITSTSAGIGDASLSCATGLTGVMTLFYNGPSVVHTNPCGVGNYLNNDVACSQTTIASPGLGLDVSKQFGIAFLLTQLDHENGAFITIRLWSNGGGSGYLRTTFPESIGAEDQDRVLFFPFSQFIANGQPINFNSISALAFEVNVTTLALDFSSTPLQVMGVNVFKAAEGSNAVAVAEQGTAQTTSSDISINAATDVNFNVYVLPGIFQENENADTKIPLRYEVTLTDTLPSEFESFGANPFSGFKVTLNSNITANTYPSLRAAIDSEVATALALTSNNGGSQTGTAKFVLTNPEGAIIKYKAKSKSKFAFCSKKITNNISVNVTLISETSSVTKILNTKYELEVKGKPVLTTSFNSCANGAYQKTPTTSAKVCNTGTGIAQNVYFEQKVYDKCSVTNKPASLTCGSNKCTGFIGDIAADGCTNVDITFDCSPLEDLCDLTTSSTLFTAKEDCANSTSTSSTCQFTYNPGNPVIETTYQTFPTIYSPKMTTVAKICNTGDGNARNTHFTQTYLTGCSATSKDGRVNCADAGCAGSLGIIHPTNCTTVEIEFNCSEFQDTCDIKDFESTAHADESCKNAKDDETKSLRFDPGVPVLETTYQNFPTVFSSKPTTVAKVQNTGNGKARNIQFTQSLLTGCSATSKDGRVTCDASGCSGSLGVLNATESTTVEIEFDCSSFETSCEVKTFSSTAHADESCKNAKDDEVDSFTSNPLLNVHISETTPNTTAARIGETLTWDIVALNNGSYTVTDYVITKKYPEYTLPNQDTLSKWNCNATTRECTLSGSTLVGSNSRTVSFSVYILGTIPVGTNEVCNTVKFETGPDVPNCVANSTASLCAPVNPGNPDLKLKKYAASTRYTFTIKYESTGTGDVNDLILYENLQAGWSLSSISAAAGWTCGASLCRYKVGQVKANETGEIEFIVDVKKEAQKEGNKTKCWENIVTTTFTDESYDPTPSNNEATVKIGSACSSCCEFPKCPENICDVTCPSTNITVNAPCPEVECKCEVPEYWCPPCQKEPSSCSCASCDKK